MRVRIDSMRIVLWSSLGLTLFLPGCGSSTPPPAKKLVPKFAYVTNYDTQSGQPYTLSGFAVDPTSGGLAPIAGSPFTAGQAPNSIAIDPGGQFLYAANVGSFNVSGYGINATTGAITPIAGSPFSTGDNPEGLVVNSSGKFLYVANNAFTNGVIGGVISGYAIDANRGV
jgi:DNA-binding beta-propeller fold protein YncE